MTKAGASVAAMDIDRLQRHLSLPASSLSHHFDQLVATGQDRDAA